MDSFVGGGKAGGNTNAAVTSGYQLGEVGDSVDTTIEAAWQRHPHLRRS
jgi:hypothetical protein